MAKGYGYIGMRMGKLLICLAVFMGMAFFAGLSGAGQSGPKPKLLPEERQNYDRQISFVRSEIEKIQQDKRWLANKVKRIEASKRVVPQRMYDSIAFKTSKIVSLEKLKNQYEKLLNSAPPPPSKKKSKAAPASKFEDTLKKRVVASGLEDWVELSATGTSLRVDNRLPIIFSSGSATIAAGYDSFIKKMASLVKGYNVRIMVDGYADTDPIHTKEFPSNFELGAARAASVVRSLVKYGVKPSVFKIGSTGEHRLDSRKRSEWKNLQRHANIAIHFKDKE
ncbi:MAG: OmpA family protein [Proteobacteria bacterium]|nr:OmpA family protein [Pseudomonadota bacterium]MBU4129337.1 OmpA family protein [Pseudomonadota bacterium]